MPLLSSSFGYALFSVYDANLALGPLTNSYSFSVMSVPLGRCSWWPCGGSACPFGASDIWCLLILLFAHGDVTSFNRTISLSIFPLDHESFEDQRICYSSWILNTGKTKQNKTKKTKNSVPDIFRCIIILFLTTISRLLYESRNQGLARISHN